MNLPHQPTAQHIIDALTATRALIAAGWCKGKAQDGDRYCLVGALAEATITDHDGTVPGYLVWRYALEAINHHIPAPWPNAVAYNDATNQHAVLQVIDNAITHTQQRGKP